MKVRGRGHGAWRRESSCSVQSQLAGKSRRPKSEDMENGKVLGYTPTWNLEPEI